MKLSKTYNSKIPASNINGSNTFDHLIEKKIGSFQSETWCYYEDCLSSMFSFMYNTHSNTVEFIYDANQNSKN